MKNPMITAVRSAVTALAVSGLLLSAGLPANASGQVNSPAPSPVSATAPAGSHTVTAGDTLGNIATQYGISLSSIFQANQMDYRTVLYPGDVIRLGGSALPDTENKISLPWRPPALAPAPSVVSAPAPAGLTSTALAYQGVPYVWGGESSVSGWDCSGFVQKVYAENGIALPRVFQWHAMTPTSTPVAGDLVVQNNGQHVGIYLGNGQMISALNPLQGTLVHSIHAMPIDGFYTV